MAFFYQEDEYNGWMDEGMTKQTRARRKNIVKERELALMVWMEENRSYDSTRAVKKGDDCNILLRRLNL